MARLARQTRVVVTGLGALAANGIGKTAFWESLLQGHSGIATISLFDASTFPIQIAGEIKDFNLLAFCDGKVNPKRLARQTQLAVAAAYLAIMDARLSRETAAGKQPLPIVMGVSSSAIDIVNRSRDRLMAQGPNRISPFFVGASQPHAVAGAVAQWIGVNTTLTTLSTACPAGLDAIATAAALIRSGRAEIAIAGGADAPVNQLTVAAFGGTGMVPTNIRDPAKASRPFDRDRQGGVLAEGAGVVVLESLEHAAARGATALLEIKGYGVSADHNAAEPASGLEDAMTLALANACFMPDQIDYVCAHGPGDPLIDRVETEVIKRVFGQHAYSLPVSSIKGVTGNPLAAAGVLQVITCALAMQSGMIPPTANYENRDPACDLDYVPKARRATIHRALIDLHGLGGGNSCMIVQQPDAI